MHGIEFEECSYTGCERKAEYVGLTSQPLWCKYHTSQTPLIRPEPDLVAVMLPRESVQAWADADCHGPTMEEISQACRLALRPLVPHHLLNAIASMDVTAWKAQGLPVGDRTAISLRDDQWEEVRDYINAMRELGDE